MQAYQYLREEEQKGLVLSLADVDVKSTFCPVKVDKILKKFKTHRCAMDFDKAFCKKIFTSVQTAMSDDVIAKFYLRTSTFCTKAT
jgi:hypothetical protein